jgi:hypothetical protein
LPETIGIRQSALLGFLRGADVTLSRAQRIATYFGLELTPLEGDAGSIDESH